MDSTESRLLRRQYAPLKSLQRYATRVQNKQEGGCIALHPIDVDILSVTIILQHTFDGFKIEYANNFVKYHYLHSKLTFSEIGLNLKIHYYHEVIQFPNDSSFAKTMLNDTQRYFVHYCRQYNRMPHIQPRLIEYQVSILMHKPIHQKLRFESSHNQISCFVIKLISHLALHETLIKVAGKYYHGSKYVSQRCLSFWTPTYKQNEVTVKSQNQKMKSTRNFILKAKSMKRPRNVNNQNIDRTILNSVVSIEAFKYRNQNKVRIKYGTCGSECKITIKLNVKVSRLKRVLKSLVTNVQLKKLQKVILTNTRTRRSVICIISECFTSTVEYT
ncbi:Hypothetical_protein [Hexamita inflata]|uniref:Hypothetical_protein n=1 Tax=Hexamita inflata TaxID=28002 RepID=A0AA86P9V0_9EUKA|nr:Hypothetical protein HINF_LOCUS22153 [Hexamita inflata]